MQYANRARNIKNKANINRDPNFEMIEKLRNRVSSKGSFRAILAYIYYT